MMNIFIVRQIDNFFLWVFPALLKLLDLIVLVYAYHTSKCCLLTG